jgi:hypothetical protein
MIPRKQQLAAEKGLAFLEAEYPDCVERFNLDTLNVKDGDRCPLAQASETNFMSACHRHNLSTQQKDDYGLQAYAPTRAGRSRQYRWLTAAYKELILERRAA